VLDRNWLPVTRTWRLNERQYGALAGRRKSQVRAEAGDEQYRRWRRSLHEVPPPSTEAQLAELASDPRYAQLGPGTLPAAESLADVQARILPYWADVLSAELRAGLVPLVVAHGNSLRALIAHLDRLDEEQVTRLDIPTGIPLRYEFDDAWEPVAGSGAYLDPEAAAVAAAAVARE
jgi:2,3-bisphosphoglycerate-dependent phosphoglycerate mutase